MITIVIVGAGLAGMSAAYELRAVLGATSRITVVGEGDRFSFTPSNPWLAVRWRKPEEITLDVARHLHEKDIAFDGSGVQRIDAERRQFRHLQESQAQMMRVEKMAALGRMAAALAHEIIGAVAEWDIAVGRQMVEIGVDVLLVADDMGANQGPLLSMKHFREFVLPYFGKVVQAYRKMGVPVIMHNDGRIWNFLDDLVATGINAYHPIERSASMDLGIVKQKYGHQICPIGNVNNKEVLREGTVREVEQQVIECLRQAAPGGGYILASDHSLNSGQKNENILAMFAAAKKYGRYPLNLPEKDDR